MNFIKIVKIRKKIFCDATIIVKYCRDLTLAPLQQRGLSNPRLLGVADLIIDHQDKSKQQSMITRTIFSILNSV